MASGTQLSVSTLDRCRCEPVPPVVLPCIRRLVGRIAYSACSWWEDLGVLAYSTHSAGKAVDVAAWMLDHPAA